MVLSPRTLADALQDIIRVCPLQQFPDTTALGWLYTAANADTTVQGH